jgi:hypothetical protein
MIRRKARFLIATLFAAIALLTLGVYAFAAQGAFDVRDAFGLLGDRFAQSAEPTAAEDALAATNCRYGVGYILTFNDSLEWIPTLNAGWYINFTTETWGSDVKSADFAPVIRVRQDRGPNGERLDTYKFTPPLVFEYQDENGQTQEGLGAKIAQNPGHYWIVGNEVDVNNQSQDNTFPQVYARAYHDAYYYIKSVDPTAKVAIAGLSMMTPGRLQYLTIVWDTYRAVYGVDMPVDIWNMHLYILEEKVPGNPLDYGDGKIALGTDPALAKLTSWGDPQYCPPLGVPDIPANDPRHDVHCRSEHDSVRIFSEQVYGMRQWMKAHGQQNKPLIISEYSLLYEYSGPLPNGGCEFLQDEHQQCFYPERVTKYLRDTIAFMEGAKDPNLGYPADENRLVQQWLWYSIVTEPFWSGGPSNLISRDFANFAPGDPAALTMMGQAFQQEATTRAGQSNLVGGVASDVVTFADKTTNTGSAVLTASFRNSGTRSIISPVTITFYSDQALTKVIGTVTYNPEDRGAITGCAWDGRNSDQVSVVWNNLPVGSHQYWAKVDTSNAVGETNEGDNVTPAGTVFVQSQGLYVPVTVR